MDESLLSLCVFRLSKHQILQGDVLILGELFVHLRPGRKDIDLPILVCRLLNLEISTDSTDGNIHSGGSVHSTYLLISWSYKDSRYSGNWQDVRLIRHFLPYRSPLNTVFSSMYRTYIDTIRAFYSPRYPNDRTLLKSVLDSGLCQHEENGGVVGKKG